MLLPAVSGAPPVHARSHDEHAPTVHAVAVEVVELARCLGCGHAPAAVGYVCTRCETALVRLLDEIPAGYARLDATPHGSGAGIDGAERSAGGYGSRPAARVDVLALTVAPRRVDHPLDLDDRHLAPVIPFLQGADAPDTSRRARDPLAGPRAELVPTVVALGRVADRCRAEGLLPPLRGPRTVAGEALRLSDPDVVCELAGRWWVGEVLDELRAAAAALRAALDEVEPSVPLGACPRKVLDPGYLDEAGAYRRAPARPCGGLVRSRDAGRAATCSADPGHRWVGDNAVRALAGAAAELHLDLPALSAYLFGLGYGVVEVGVLRKWAQRDGWGRRSVGRRRLYRVGDVLISADRRRRVSGVSDVTASSGGAA